MSSIANIANAISADASLESQERASIVEIAFLAVAADRTIHPDEEAALRSIARKISPEGDAKVDALIKELGASVDRERATERLHAAAKNLTTPIARGLAYKAAYAVALADLAASDEEFEFDLDVIDALGLPQEAVETLMEEVIVALGTE